MADDGFQKKVYSPGEIILEEGGRGEAIYLITAGKVEIRKKKSDGDTKKIAILEKGDIIGEMALLDGRPHMATAICITETSITTMSKEVFDKKMEQMDPIVRSAVQTLVKRARVMAETYEMEEDFLNKYV